MDQMFEAQHTVKLNLKVAYPLREWDSKLEKILAKEYECPVCLSFAAPPIMMCLNSHIICFDCWKRCSNCPACRIAKSLTRAHALEKIHPLVTFPCKWEGCSFAASASYTVVHEHFCKFFPLKCPLGDSHQCDWMGTMQSVEGHLRANHEANVYFEPNVCLASKGFCRAFRKDYTIIFVVHGRLFKFYWSFDVAVSPKVKFGMVTLGNGNPVVIYSYSVIFAKKFPIKSNCRKLKVVKAHVKTNRDPSLGRVFSYEQDFAELASFCSHGDLVYQVIIDVSHLTKYNELTSRLNVS